MTSQIEPIKHDQAISPSHLYTMPLWREKLGNGQCEIRSEVRHVLSGEVRYFRQAPEMMRYLAGKSWAPGLIAGWLGQE